jgi:hypothetical protein
MSQEHAGERPPASPSNVLRTPLQHIWGATPCINACQRLEVRRANRNPLRQLSSVAFEQLRTFAIFTATRRVSSLVRRFYRGRKRQRSRRCALSTRANGSKENTAIGDDEAVAAVYQGAGSQDVRRRQTSPLNKASADARVEYWPSAHNDEEGTEADDRPPRRRSRRQRLRRRLLDLVVKRPR